MTYRGKVKNGVVVLEKPSALPEGTEVSVRPLKGSPHKGGAKKAPKTMYERYRRFIGMAKGYPPDGSINIDHYLYGAPKKK